MLCCRAMNRCSAAHFPVDHLERQRHLGVYQWVTASDTARGIIRVLEGDWQPALGLVGARRLVGAYAYARTPPVRAGGARAPSALRPRPIRWSLGFTPATGEMTGKGGGSERERRERA